MPGLLDHRRGRCLRGERGLPVRIRVERAGEKAPLAFTIVRESVPLPSLRNAYMIRPGTGYIGLTGGFQHTTGDELREAISKLKAQGMNQIVLDLRGNPGGLLDQAIDVASEFLPRDYPITSVHGRVEYKVPYVYRSTGTDPEEGSALGVAMVDFFRERGAHVMVTTHYSGLKMYATNTLGVLNASVEFDERTLKPTYHLLTGLAGFPAMRVTATMPHMLATCANCGRPATISPMA